MIVGKTDTKAVAGGSQERGERGLVGILFLQFFFFFNHCPFFFPSSPSNQEARIAENKEKVHTLFPSPP